MIGTTPEEANQSEDAFRLNIWTSDTKGKLPVLFWIHGGGFMTGGGALRWYHGNQLAASGRIVVVTVNYRLGSLGNLYLPGVSEGNLALQDLLAALHWVQDNIAAFGGDPNSITIAEQSMELPFLFGNFEKWENAPMLENADDDNIRLLSNKLQQVLLNFVVLGVPNTKDSILWPKYNVEKRMTLVLDEESEAVSDPLDMQSRIHELILN